MRYPDVLIISDVDDTLLEKGFGVSGRNIKAVERFVSRGGLFTVATDRSVESVGRFVDWVPLSAPAILLGGAVIYDYKNTRFLKRRGIGVNWRTLVGAMCGEFPDICAEAYGDELCYIVKAGDIAVRLHGVEHTSYTVTDPEFVTEQVYKLRFSYKPDELHRVYSHLVSLIEAQPELGRVCAVFTSKETIDVYANGINKRAAAAELGLLLGVPQSNVAAIGDGADDIPLLQYAGFSALTGNAAETAFGSADIVVGTCSQGGVADFIEQVEKRFKLV